MTTSKGPRDIDFCRVCRAKVEEWASITDWESSTSQEFRLGRCADCGSITTAGDPPPIHAYESGLYSQEDPIGSRLLRRILSVLDHQVVRWLRRSNIPAGGRVIDVGAGSGRLIIALRSAGWNAFGIEPGLRSSSQAIARGLPVSQVSLEDYKNSDLDAAVLWHVLEHVEDPRAALIRISSWLKPGGGILVAVPLATSWQARLAGTNWWHWDVPRHRTHFSEQGLRTLGRDLSLTVERVHYLSWEHGPAGMWMAALSRLGLPSGYPFRVLKRTIRPKFADLPRVLVGAFLVPVALCTELLAARWRAGGAIAAYYRLPLNLPSSAVVAPQTPGLISQFTPPHNDGCTPP